MDSSYPNLSHSNNEQHFKLTVYDTVFGNITVFLPLNAFVFDIFFAYLTCFLLFSDVINFITFPIVEILQ